MTLNTLKIKSVIVFVISFCVYGVAHGESHPEFLVRLKSSPYYEVQMDVNKHRYHFEEVKSGNLELDISNSVRVEDNVFQVCFRHKKLDDRKKARVPNIKQLAHVEVVKAQLKSGEPIYERIFKKVSPTGQSFVPGLLSCEKFSVSALSQSSRQRLQEQKEREQQRLPQGFISVQ